MTEQGAWGHQLREFRLSAGYLTQGLLADAASELVASLSFQEYKTLQAAFDSDENGFELSQTMISRWETGARKPPRNRSRHLCLIWALVSLGGIDRPAAADKWLGLADLRPLSLAERTIFWPQLVGHESSNHNQEEDVDNFRGRIEDWGEAPHGALFFGREAEQTQLHQWLLNDRCRLIGLWGMGGQGKTSLAAKVCRQAHAQFDGIIWRSLLNAPPLSEILESWIQLLSHQQLVDLPTSLNEQLLLLFELLSTQRMLLVLDNIESILVEGDVRGGYRTGYEAYGQLFLRFGEGTHLSCLLLTSREEPPEFTRLRSRPIRPEEEFTIQTMRLDGLDLSAGEALLTADIGHESPESMRSLYERYSGNPLALLLVSSAIREYYGGQPELFLSQESTIFSDVRELLTQHLDRLTDRERYILYWLAIEREPVTAHLLRTNLVLPVAQSRLMESVRSLQRRSLIEVHQDNRDGIPRFSLQNVVIEYLTGRIVQTACEAFQSSESSLKFLHHLALIKATSKSYIHQSQIRLILAPIAENLMATMGRGALRKRIDSWLDALRHEGKSVGYTAGNILNVLLWLDEDLEGLDFSHLPVWQVLMEAKSLRRVNFAHADLSDALIYESFGRILTLAFDERGDHLFAGTTHGQLRAFRTAGLQPVDTKSGPLQHLQSLALSADSRTLVSSGMDRLIHVWSLNPTDDNPSSIRSDSAQNLTTYPAEYLQHRYTIEEMDRVRAVALCANDTILAIGVKDTIRLWDVNKQRYEATLKGHTGLVFNLAYAPLRHMLASAGGDERVMLWHVASGEFAQEPNAVLNQTCKILDVAFSANGQWLAVARIDGAICLWDTNQFLPRELTMREDSDEDNLEPLLTLKADTARVNSISFSPDGRWLVSGSSDHTIRVWQIPSGNTHRLMLGHRGEVDVVRFSPDGTIVASGSSDRTLRLWEAATGKELRVLGSFVDGILSALAVSSDGQTLISGSDDGSVRVWNRSTQECQFTLHAQDNYIFSVAFSPDGQSFASASLDKSICVWSTKTGTLIHRLEGYQHGGHHGEVTTVAYHPTEPILASGSSDRTLCLWDRETGRCLQQLRSPGGAIWGIAFSPDGERIASACSSGSVYVWSVKEKKVVQELRHQQDIIWAVAFSPDGKQIASAGFGGNIRIWDVESSNPVHAELPHGGWVRSLAFSPDSQQLLSTGDNQEVCLWDLQNGCERYRRAGKESVVFMPDGLHFACSTARWMLRLWETSSGDCTGEFKAEGPFHGTNITGVTGISPAQRETLKLMGATGDI